MAAWGRSIAAWARAAVGPDTSGTADGELLARFALSRDPAAFELLVWRHGGMVFRTALAVTRDHHAAEDVAQATFLVLAKRAGSLRHGDAVAGFLHTTARRIALRAASRRKFVALPEGLAAAAGPADDISAAVHEEVARLPEVWRVPVLLCFFEGLTHAEAAERLGKPVGSVAGWVARAKERLHDRLTRRGVSLPAAGLASLCAVGPADAKFVAAVSGSAVAYVGGSLVSSPVVLQLVHGAYRAMILAKLKVAATAGVIALGAAGLTVGGWAYTTAQVPGPPPAAADEKPPAAVVGPAADPVPTPEDGTRSLSLVQSNRSLANLKKLQAAMLAYEAEYKQLPTDITSVAGQPATLSWRVKLLPYLGEQKLWEQFKLDQPWDSEHNFKLLAKLPECLRVGFEPKGGTHTYYQVFRHPGAALLPIVRNPKLFRSGMGFPGYGVAGESTEAKKSVDGFTTAPQGIGEPRTASITDGLSQTIGVLECCPPVPWTKPADLTPPNPEKWLRFDHPFHIAFHVGTMDGSAHVLSTALRHEQLWALLTAARKDVIPADTFTKYRVQLPANAAEEKARVEKAQAEIAQLSKTLVKAHAENYRHLAARLRESYSGSEQLSDHLKKTLEELLEHNELLAAPKK